MSRYWLNPKPADPEQFQAQVQGVCSAYHEALRLEAEGVHTVSSDEKTGMQALERAAPTLPMRPGRIERQEFEYIRHGTLCLTANFNVATGRIISPTIQPTRDEEDCVANVMRVIDTDPLAGWVFVMDNLNTHCSEGLVRMVAEKCGINDELGVKGRRGVLATMETRAAFLSDSTHRIRFVYTPKHCSWLNQVEIWFSILVRRLLKRASFVSLDDLHQRVLAFIDYFNAVLAKPFKWTYTGRQLKA
jgi:transposase